MIAREIKINYVFWRINSLWINSSGWGIKIFFKIFQNFKGSRSGQWKQFFSEDGSLQLVLPRQEICCALSDVSLQRCSFIHIKTSLSADFSKETLQTRRGWKEIFQVMKGKGLHPRLLYPAKLSLRMKGQRKCFPDKVKLKEFIITEPLF